MIFSETPLSGGWLIRSEPKMDARGAFARTFCAQEFAQHDLEHSFVQANISTNENAGTVRGLHFQKEPHTEVKLVRCVKGAIFDVMVDLRRESPTYLKWFGAELSEGNHLMMYVPKGFAHGYQALTDGATVSYLVSEFYVSGAEAGCRFDDPLLSIRWPHPPGALSDKDRAWPLLHP